MPLGLGRRPDELGRRSAPGQELRRRRRSGRPGCSTRCGATGARRPRPRRRGTSALAPRSRAPGRAERWARSLEIVATPRGGWACRSKRGRRTLVLGGDCTVGHRDGRAGPSWPTRASGWRLDSSLDTATQTSDVPAAVPERRALALDGGSACTCSARTEAVRAELVARRPATTPAARAGGRDCCSRGSRPSRPPRTSARRSTRRGLDAGSPSTRSRPTPRPRRPRPPR